MPISEFTKLAQGGGNAQPTQPSSFTRLAATNTPPAKKPVGLVRTLAPELIKKGVKSVQSYILNEEDKRKKMTLGELFVNDVIEKPAKILKFASVDLPRYTLGGFASVGKSVMEATIGSVVGKDVVRRSFTPKTDETLKMSQVDPDNSGKINEFFFKDSNPLSYQQLKEQVDTFAKDSPDATDWEKANLGTTIAVLGFAADAIPGKPSAGNISKKLLKELAKDLDEVSIVTKLIAEDVPEAVATRAAVRIVEAKTPKAVERAVQLATKETLDEVTDLRTKGAVPESIPSQLRPLATEAKLYDTVEEFISRATKSFDEIPVYAKNALAGQAKADGLTDIPYRKSRFVEMEMPISEIRKTSPDTFSDTFTKRGSVTKGPIVMDDAGTIIDGNNRAREAFDRGDNSISVLLEVPNKADLEDLYAASSGVKITGSAQDLGSTQALAPQTQVGEPHPTPGMTVLEQTGQLGDSEQVRRAFAGEYTGGDGVSRTVDEMAEDIMTTTAEPQLAARTIATMQSAKTKILEYVQNTEERIRKLQDDPSLRITDDSNPYQQMALMPGALGDKIEKVQDRLKTIFKDMNETAKAGGRKLEDMRKDVNDFLWLRHAPERNASLGDGAAGITTEEAAKRMDILKASPQYADVVRLGDEVAAMNKEALDTLLDSGVITRELYETLTEKYQNYVPLNRIFEETSDVAGSLSGRGFDVKSTGIKRAKGSSRDVSDIVENTILNYEQAMMRAEKNIVDRATLQFVRDNEAALDGLMEVKRPRGLETTDDPQILQLFDQGKRVWINIKDPNLAIAMKGTGRQKLPEILYPVAAFTRLMSGLATRWAADFAPVNIIRDIQERMVFLSAQKGIGGKEAFKSVTRDPASIKAVTDAVMGRDTEGAALYAEMKRLGGTTGGMGLSTRKKTQLNIRQLEKLAQSKPRQFAEGTLEYLDRWNTIFEDSTRLTTYKTALANGMSKRQAAALAKEATVNFNRMGKGGPVINALYLFANASIQGSVKTIRALKNPKVLAGMTVIVGTAVTAVNEWNDSVDPEWRKKMSKWDVVNSLPVVLPSDDGTFRTFNIPVAYGIKPMRVTADYAYQMANDQDVTAVDMTEGVISAIMESYNPVGGTDIMSAATPTILDLPLEIARNQKWSGSVIKPDFDPYAPESTKYFDELEDKTSGKIAISLTEQLAGFGVEVSPADIVYAFESYIGGAGRFTNRLAELGIAPASGRELPAISDFPFISRFYKAKAEDEIFNTQAASNLKELMTEERRDSFYMKKKAQDAWDSIAELPPDEKKTKLRALAVSDPALFDKVADIGEAEKMGLVGEERQLKTAPVAVRASYIAAEMKQLATKEERRALLQNYIDKKIASEAVLDAMEELKAEQE